MFEDLGLPLIAAAVLLWSLVCALQQRHDERPAEPMFIWREATTTGWSEWRDLTAVPASTDYTGVLAAVRARASRQATAVQFASVVHPADAPDYTLRVLYLSAVREPSPDRLLTPTR